MNKKVIEWVEKKIANLERVEKWYDSRNEIAPTVTIQGKINFTNILESLKALDQAEGVLPEKLEATGKEGIGYVRGHNDVIYQATPILAKAKLRIEELETKFICSSCGGSVPSKDNEYSCYCKEETLKSELQFLKEKLTVENLEKIIKKDALFQKLKQLFRIDHSINIDNYFYSEDLAQALIKEFGGGE